MPERLTAAERAEKLFDAVCLNQQHWWGREQGTGIITAALEAHAAEAVATERERAASIADRAAECPVADDVNIRTAAKAQARWVAAAIRGGEHMERRHAALPIGSPVVKVDGYRFPGEIRAVFTNRAGGLRYVVEATGAEYAGLLHIFNSSQIATILGGAP